MNGLRILADAIDELKSTVNNLPKADAADPGGILVWGLTLAGIAAAGGFTYAGVMYATAHGDPGKLAKAKNAVVFTVIGLIMIILAVAIVTFVVNTATTANG